MSICLTGVLGWGRERPVKQQAIGVNLWQGLDHHGFRVQIVFTKHCSRPKGRNDGWITSLSHRTKGGYKNLPLPSPPPPHYQKNRRLYRKTCFRKFSKLSGTKVQNVKTGVLGFLTLGKGINTRTDNLRYTWLILIPAQRRSGPLRIRGGWNGVATGVRRSRVPLVLYNESKHNILALLGRQGQQSHSHCPTKLNSNISSQNTNEVDTSLFQSCFISIYVILTSSMSPPLSSLVHTPNSSTTPNTFH
jgi:hypothetical protein